MRGSIGSGAAWVLTASVIAAACTSAPLAQREADPDPDGEITTQVRFIPGQIDPHRTGTNAEQLRHSAMVFEALMTFDPKTLTPIPAAAKDHPRISDDGLTYTFTLRDGLTYSDGSPLRAKDFVYAFSRPCDLATRGPQAFIIAGCENLSRMDPAKTPADELVAAKERLGLKANGDKEFVVTLTERAPYLTTLVALPLGYPVRESDVTKAGAAYGSEASTFVGNGPFKIVDWKANERLVFERNDRYRTPAKLKRWTKVVIGDDLAFAAYRNNEIDFYGGVPSGRLTSVAGNLAVIEADPELRAQLVDLPGAVTDMFVLNASRPPFTDRSLRQAFAKAVDRDTHIRDLTRFGEPAHSLIPPGRPGHDPGDRFQQFDPSGARELLQSSKFAGRPELAEIRFNYEGTVQTILPYEWFQQQIKRNLGVEIVLEAVDPVRLARMFESPRTVPQIRFMRLGNGEPPDPQFWLTRLFHSSRRFASDLGYKNPEFDALVRDADRERDPGRRADLYRRASRILSEDAIAVWHWWGPNQYLRKPRVKGVTDSGADVEYGILRLTEIHVTKRP